ncbi:MAG: ABC transporter [Candidatus Kerfeldbacteria bacterium RIFCSPLOWO2_01_FULL_48_11]|uniref:ABC transporter n=1 Tax=Candidatus Kerfeldbacteria bacterium RIFCSPLOWO2_01_FULL_48_11 TaxID=1798543 RepID=A0A1G2B435_9BACT|nr:MAG: ABC transporter related protein [Parcubacteria group bacterium GW2011_GWA2_48_9]OGY82987.1 MAG: ABC transporter [Candidatus Kerfeldbacteria bacterium RIFCSPLOWO2_01_FULL_48_11]HCM68529.1 ABC transporter [Candidatus Kerfeldbacteria bacterium]
MENIIEVKDLTKKYGDFTAVDAISFTVQRGETFGILGPNGAGKTTTLEMIEGLKSITSGEVLVDGHDVHKDPRLVKSLIGVQLQSSSFFDGLNLKELVETFGALYSRTVDGMKLLKDVQLDEKWKSQVKELSGGQKQRLSIAVALVNDPKIIFLDEPTTGLDPQARRNLWDLVNAIKLQGKTVVLTTHYMEEAEILCDRIAIMDHAKIITMDSPINLLKQSGVGSQVEFHVDHHVDEDRFKNLPGVQHVVVEDHGVRLTTNDPQRVLTSLFQLEQSAGFKIFDMQLHQATLEDVFLKLTGRTLRE